jgi:hypothetical protein
MPLIGSCNRMMRFYDGFSGVTVTFRPGLALKRILLLFVGGKTAVASELYIPNLARSFPSLEFRNGAEWKHDFFPPLSEHLPSGCHPGCQCSLRPSSLWADSSAGATKGTRGAANAGPEHCWLCHSEGIARRLKPARDRGRQFHPRAHA